MSGMENNSTAFVGCDNGHVSILIITIGHCTVLARKLSQWDKSFQRKQSIRLIVYGSSEFQTRQLKSFSQAGSM